MFCVHNLVDLAHEHLLVAVDFGDFAWDPARLADGYFAGMGEFSRQYLHSPYIGLIRG